MFRLRRPLALICLLFLQVLFFLVLLLPPEETELPWQDGETARITGRLVRREYRRNADGQEEAVWYVDTGDPTLRIQCYMDFDAGKDADAPVGAGVTLTGRVRRFSAAGNPGEFDAAAYYRILGIACRVTGAGLIGCDNSRDPVGDTLFRVRSVLAASLDACLSEEDAGIMRAMLLGDRSAMDRDTKTLYRRSGIIHILAISGLHISLIGMGLFAVLCRLCCPRAPAAGICMFVMLAYGEMCGETPSAIRAIVMFVLRLAAIVTGKSYDILTALAIAAVLIVIEQPLYLLHSGFLLSALSVLSIGAFLPALSPPSVRNYIPARGDPPWKRPMMRLISGILASLSVSLVTLPVHMLFFYTFPVYSVFLNVLILPLMSVVVGAGILCMSAGLLCVPAGMIPGAIDHLLLFVFEHLCLAENALPGAVWTTGAAKPPQVAVYYVMLICYVLAVRTIGNRERKAKKRRERERCRVLRIAIPVLWLTAALWVLSFRSSPDLKITVLDVGQGDGIVIEGEDMRFLIDGGSSSRSGTGSYVIGPYLAYAGISHLDAAILTHEDEDHMNGLLELLEDEADALSIGRLVLPDVAAESRGENYRLLVRTAAEHHVPVSYIVRGEELLRGKISIRCLGPAAGMRTDEPNAYSTILYLRCGDFSALFTGDVEGDGEIQLMRFLAEDPQLARDLTFLKVAHHGSRYTTCGEFLDLVKPRFSVISCGRNNRYGHPHEELLARLNDRGIPSFITAEHGAVTIDVSRGGRNVRVSGFLDE
ncbi:MAG: DNA internalization-related competence protein ComEC/Rec2 [Lachnospiraceae bacterium]|nr:DNA internalization-related competence protein ComEC/Rec2 [Lachnospiraceae bacterium]